MTPKTELLSVRIKPEIKRSLEAEAQADSRTVSSLVTKILADWAKRKKRG